MISQVLNIFLSLSMYIIRHFYVHFSIHFLVQINYDHLRNQSLILLLNNSAN